MTSILNLNLLTNSPRCEIESWSPESPADAGAPSFDGPDSEADLATSVSHLRCQTELEVGIEGWTAF